MVKAVAKGICQASDNGYGSECSCEDDPSKCLSLKLYLSKATMVVLAMERAGLTMIREERR